VRYVKRALLALVGLLILAYLADYAWVRTPFPPGRNRFGTVTVRPYYDVKLKSGKSDLYFLDAVDQTCVHSLLPHLGYKPCWYLRKHARQRIEM